MKFIISDLRAADHALRAALKRPQSKRCRDCRTLANRAKRMDCGVFTAAFSRHNNDVTK